jgi:hypothetical protein
MSQPQSLNLAIMINTAMALMFSKRDDDLFEMHTRMLSELVVGDQSQKPNFPKEWQLRYVEHREMSKAELQKAHEALFAAMQNNKKFVVSMPICSICESNDITWFCSSKWDPSKSAWIPLSEEPTMCHCNVCRQHTKVKWANYSNVGQGKYSPYMGEFFNNLTPA